MADKVLIVDDDPAIRRMLEKVMHSNELECAAAASGQEALKLLDAELFDIILMDIMLGDMEGFEVIKKLRGQGISTPVIIISGRDEDYDTLYGLSLGADDYITKPFRPVIIGAKVKALIRRDKTHMMGVGMVSCGSFGYDTSAMRFYKKGVELNLSSKEGSLLLLFLQNPNQVFSKENIYEHVWGNLVAVDDNAIMVYINRVRSKIEEDPAHPKHVVTVRGLGYRFVP